MSKQYFITLSDASQYPYQLIQSLRAKRLSIKFSSVGELSVVVPRGKPASLAHSFLQKKSSWVEKQLRHHTAKPSISVRPDSLDLKMLKEKWVVQYKESVDGHIEYRELSDYCLLITGEINSDKLVNKVIGLFLKNKASQLFCSMISELAKQYNFQYNGMTLRGQKGRWGSCSSQKKLNLNYKLLLMPEAVTRYVFIHELCHTIEMNHSAKFWQLVEKIIPEYRQHQQYLKKYGAIIRYY
jgi:predicted metal-dependent hydrolase